MTKTRLRNAVITLFVIVWTAVFHYESLRYFYLNSLFKRDLPKLKLLFPPAGWIMFFDVDDAYATVDVYGIKGNSTQLIDPHDIFRTRTFGFDNIHRGIMGIAANREKAPMFCQFLRRRFPYFEKFAIVQDYYPSITKEPYHRMEQVLYQCTE
jgi:hypothetical protein